MMNYIQSYIMYMILLFAICNSIPLSKRRTTNNNKKKTQYAIVDMNKNNIIIPHNKYYNDINVDEHNFQSIEDIILKEAHVLFDKPITKLSNKDGPMLQKEVYDDRTHISEMPPKAFVIKVIAPLRHMASGLNMDFHGQMNHRIRMEKYLLELLTRHEKVCILLRKKRNNDARYIFNQEQNLFIELHSSNINADVATTIINNNKNTNNRRNINNHHDGKHIIDDDNSIHMSNKNNKNNKNNNDDNVNENVPESIKSNLYHQNQRIPTLTMQSAVTSSIPQEITNIPAPRLFEKIRRAIHFNLVAYKDESRKSKELVKNQLSQINKILQHSCKQPPRIFMKIANKLKEIKSYQNKLGKEIDKYYSELQVLYNDSITIEQIRLNRSIVMRKWKYEMHRSNDLNDSHIDFNNLRDKVDQQIRFENFREKHWNKTNKSSYFHIHGNPACTKICRSKLRHTIKMLTKEINDLNKGRIEKLPLSQVNAKGNNTNEDKGFNKYGSCSERNNSCNECLKDNLCGWCGNQCVEGNGASPLYVGTDTCLEDITTAGHINNTNQTINITSTNGDNSTMKIIWRHIESLAYPTCATRFDPTKNTTFNSTNKNQEEEPVRESEHLWSKSSGNETASIHIPTKRLNNYKIPVYLGAEDIGSNRHWIGKKGVRTATYNLGQNMCNGFAASPADCERQIKRMQAKYGKGLFDHAPLERSGFFVSGGWSNNLFHKAQNHVSSAPKKDDNTRLVNHQFEHESEDKVENLASGGGTEDLAADVGTLVDTRWLGGCIFEEATISSVNPDGTFDVKFTSGREEKQVLRDWMKPRGSTSENGMCKAIGCIEVHGGGCTNGDKKWPEYPDDILNPKVRTHKKPEENSTDAASSTVSVSCTKNSDCKAGLEICSIIASCGQPATCPSYCIPVKAPSKKEEKPSLLNDKKEQEKLMEESLKPPPKGAPGEAPKDPNRSPLAVNNKAGRKHLPRKKNPKAFPQEFPRPNSPLSSPTGKDLLVLL